MFFQTVNIYNVIKIATKAMRTFVRSGQVYWIIVFIIAVKSACFTQPSQYCGPLVVGVYSTNLHHTTLCLTHNHNYSQLSFLSIKTSFSKDYSL